MKNEPTIHTMAEYLLSRMHPADREQLSRGKERSGQVFLWLVNHRIERHFDPKDDMVCCWHEKTGQDYDAIDFLHLARYHQIPRFAISMLMSRPTALANIETPARPVWPPADYSDPQELESIRSKALLFADFVRTVNRDLVAMETAQEWRRAHETLD